MRTGKRLARVAALVGMVTVAGAALALAPGATETTTASSHREAPSISKDPVADNVDVYAFVSPDKPDTVSLIATYIPGEDPAGGPNFYEFGDDVLYEIHVDNDGDGKENLTYQFRFDGRIRDKDSYLYAKGPLTSPTDPDWNLPQTYNVTRVEHGPRDRTQDVATYDAEQSRRGRTRILASNVPVTPNNVGPRTNPDFAALSAAAVANLQGGGKVFAGQVDDPFYVDLGSIFDLGGLRPFNSAHLLPLPTAAGVDSLSGFNTHAIALQLPITELTRDGKMPSGPTDPKAVIGVYASASRQKIRVLTESGNDLNSGPWVQVSRLGNPLVNEVIIPLGQKDYWNRQDPHDDAQFLKRYTNPELSRLVNLLYPVLPDAPTTNRDDLVAVLLTGIPGLNFTGPTKADLLRLNMAIPPAASPQRLGALAGDFAGFPNGRRLADDIVDIEVRALACGYGDILAGALGLCNLSPNNTLGDGVDANDKPFGAVFPYMAPAHQGYNHAHDHDN